MTYFHFVEPVMLQLKDDNLRLNIILTQIVKLLLSVDFESAGLNLYSRNIIIIIIII
jgi:hypothetical protein